MVYDKIFRSWRAEKASPELQPLPADFYSEAGRYLKELGALIRTGKASDVVSALRENELRVSRALLLDLVHTRMGKLLALLAKGAPPSTDSLSAEERRLVAAIEGPIKEAMGAILGLVLEQAKNERKPSRIVLRFMAQVPAIIGSDTRSYGPFKPEDVASLPYENAIVLIEQKFAKKIM